MVLAEPVINVCSSINPKLFVTIDWYKVTQACRVSSACAYAPLPRCVHAPHCVRPRAHGRAHAGGCS